MITKRFLVLLMLFDQVVGLVGELLTGVLETWQDIVRIGNVF